MGRIAASRAKRPIHDFIAGLLAALAILAAAFSCGCGPAGSTGATYSVKRAGVVVGSETVSLEDGDGRVTYRSSARRPFLEYDSSFERRFSVSPDGRRLVDYYESGRRNGVIYRTYVKSAAGVYEYLRDGLQMFSYAAGLSYAEGVLPLEPDCAATVQAVLDGLLALKGGESGPLVIVPSRNYVGRQAELVPKGEGRAALRVAGIGDLSLTYDPASGRLERVENAAEGLTIERAGVERLISKAYAPTERVVKEVRVPTIDGLELAGSFYVPKAKPPYGVAVLVGDFGPEDRTGVGLLSQVAERLAGDGIAVLTCDRRGVRPSGGKYATYTLETAVNDLNSELDYLVLRSDIDTEKMYVVGYGEGGVIASYAATGNPYVAACVLLAAPSVRAFPDLALLDAGEAGRSGELPPGDVDVARGEIDALTSALGVVEGDFVEAMGRTLFLGWMRSYAGSDTLAAVGSLRVPVLVLQGGRDDVVGPEQARELYGALEARGKGVQELVVFDGLGHEFGREVGEAAARPYRSHPALSPEVTRTISRWLKER